MTLSPKARKAVLIVTTIAMFFAASFAQNRLNGERKRLGLTRDDDPLKNAPPLLAFTTVALGSFRGLIANALWVRLADLQENDKYFEMVQLADWISKLQPQIPTVWVHLAWNMSYNISIKFSDPRDRWPWVLRGIELLRDEGIRYNPKEPLIYRELAWHFQHKMGDNLDDAHEYYKRIWADEMAALLGKGKVNWAELLNPQTAEAQERVRVLREKYKMDPAVMKEVDGIYGPLEWRLPESHSVYWAYFGIEKTEKDKVKKEDVMQVRRNVFHSMQMAFRRGRIVHHPSDPNQKLFYGPNLDIVPQASKAYEDMMDAEPENRDHISKGHKNFLLTAVYFLYTHKRLDEADKWFREVKKLYPEAVPPNTSLEEFAFSRVQEDIGETSHDRVTAVLMGLISNSFVSLALGDDDQAAQYHLLSQKIHDRYQSEIGPLQSTQVRISLKPFEELRREVLRQLLNPEYGLVPELAATLRTKLQLPADYTGEAPEGTEAKNPTGTPPQ